MTNPATHSRDQHRPERSLRVGVILGGRIVEEQIVRRRGDVSIGQSARNDFSVPVDGVPRRWNLFVVRDGRYFLHVPNTATGRLSDTGTIVPLSRLEASATERDARGWMVPLTDTARGKIVLGDMTLLFQFVAAPPRQPRPHLPASVRGTLADRIDAKLACIVAASIMVHFVVFMWARFFHDPPTPRVDNLYQEAVVEYDRAAMFVDIAPTPLPTRASDTPTPTATDPVAPTAARVLDRRRNPDRTTVADKPTPLTDAELQARAALDVGQLFSDDLTDVGDSGSMRDRNPGNRLSDEIAAVENDDRKVQLSRGDDDRLRRADKPRRATGDGPQIDTGTDAADTGPVGPAVVVKRPKVTIEDPTIEDPPKNWSLNKIMAKIKRQYSGGLKRCFKRVLLTDENAGGTIGLTFKVGTRGNVTRAKVDGFGFSTFDSCVEAKVKNWRFDPPVDEDGDPTSPTVSMKMPFVGR